MRAFCSTSTSPCDPFCQPGPGALPVGFRQNGLGDIRRGLQQNGQIASTFEIGKRRLFDLKPQIRQDGHAGGFQVFLRRLGRQDRISRVIFDAISPGGQPDRT